MNDRSITCAPAGIATSGSDVADSVSLTGHAAGVVLHFADELLERVHRVAYAPRVKLALRGREPRQKRLTLTRVQAAVAGGRLADEPSERRRDGIVVHDGADTLAVRH